MLGGPTLPPEIDTNAMLGGHPTLSCSAVMLGMTKPGPAIFRGRRTVFLRVLVTSSYSVAASDVSLAAAPAFASAT